MTGSSWAAWAVAWDQAARFDPYHKGPGPAGGQFTSSGQAGSGTAAGKPRTGHAKPGTGHAKPGPSAAAGRAAEKRTLLARAAADRKEIASLEAQLRALEHQQQAAHAAHAAAAAAARKARAAGKPGTPSRPQAAAHHQAARKHHRHYLTLKSRIAALRSRISHLRQQVARLDAAAAKL